MSNVVDLYKKSPTPTKPIGEDLVDAIRDFDIAQVRLEKTVLLIQHLISEPLESEVAGSVKIITLADYR